MMNIEGDVILSEVRPKDLNINKVRHCREGGNPLNDHQNYFEIPVYTGMTVNI